MRRAYIDVPEGQMHYRHAGSGSPVVLLHMSGSSSQEYEQIGEMLSARFSVYAPDILAFGSSDAPPRHYSLSEHARVIKSFMDALNIDKAYIAGNMVGSNIAAHFALQFPDRVISLFLGQYCYDPDFARFRSRREDPVFLPIHPAADGSHLKEIWKRADRYPVAPEIIDARALCLHQAGALGESLHHALFEDEDFLQILPFITVPTVVVAYGAFAECDMETYVAELIPGAILETLEGATPYVTRSDPKAWGELFLKHNNK